MNRPNLKLPQVAGKRYLVAWVVVPTLLLITGILLPVARIGDIIVGAGIALLSVLPIFWYDSQQKEAEAKTELSEAYVSVAEELKLNSTSLTDPTLAIGDVPAAGLEKSVWTSLLGLGRIARFQEDDRDRLRGLYADVVGLNELMQIHRLYSTTPPMFYADGRGGNFQFPDPLNKTRVRNVIESKAKIILDEIGKILSKWEDEDRIPRER